jgi:hypothetical protein
MLRYEIECSAWIRGATDNVPTPASTGAAGWRKLTMTGSKLLNDCWPVRSMQALKPVRGGADGVRKVDHRDDRTAGGR